MNVEVLTDSNCDREAVGAVGVGALRKHRLHRLEILQKVALRGILVEVCAMFEA
jgi:hypothetical protein